MSHRFSDNLNMREKEVVLSDEEHRQLINYKDEMFEEHTPLGFVVGQLIKNNTDTEPE